MGIYALIKAKVEPLDETRYKTEYRISNNVWICFNERITAPSEDIAYMINGLKSVSSTIDGKIDESIIIVITDFQISLTDYQKEGMFYAFAGWATNHFKLTPNEINCYFNKKNNLYVFPELK